MTKIVHPYAHRLGIIKDWKSRWFSLNADFRLNLKGDMLMRGWLTENLKNQYVGKNTAKPVSAPNMAPLYPNALG